MPEPTENRRDGFRMDDQLKLQVKPIHAEEIETIVSDFDAFRIRYCLKAHLLSESEVRKPKLERIRKRDPEVAEYLEHLEAQISHLATRLADDSEMDFDEIKENTAVNLSASGISFTSDCIFDVGQMLELGLALESSGTQLVAVVEVLRVEKIQDSEAGYWVSTSYKHIHADDVEAIIRHMAKLQQRELQARRQT